MPEPTLTRDNCLLLEGALSHAYFQRHGVEHARRETGAKTLLDAAA